MRSALLLSEVATWTASGNCLVSPYDDFTYLKRFSATQLQDLTLLQARQTFGLDADAVAVAGGDPAAIFVDPANGDWRVRADGPCAGKGAALP